MNSDSSQNPHTAQATNRPGADAGVRGHHDLKTVVHDLRNVVAPLRNAVHLLRFQGKTNAALAPITDIIDRQVNEMIRMLDTLAGAESPFIEGGAPMSIAHTNATPASGRKVLIVDDNVALLTSLSSVLRDAGHGVKTAENGPEALALAASWSPEFVLLDANMPKMNGFEVAKMLRAKFSQESMKLILMSGFTLDEATRRGAERAGFDHCIDKIHSFSSLDSVLCN